MKVRFKAEKKYRDELPKWEFSKFCLVFFESLLKVGNSALVKSFLTDLCPCLGGVEDNDTLISSIVAPLHAYDWNDIGSEFQTSLGKLLSQTMNL